MPPYRPAADLGAGKQFNSRQIAAQCDDTFSRLGRHAGMVHASRDDEVRDSPAHSTRPSLRPQEADFGIGAGPISHPEVEPNSRGILLSPFEGYRPKPEAP